MAVDEWLAWRASFDSVAVLLRLYTWKVGAITVGLHQKPELAVDFSKLSGASVVRRVTGGRAVYHDPSELTYALAVNRCHLSNVSLTGNLADTSAVIAGALKRFLARLGIESKYVRRSSARDSSPAFFHTAPCFDSVSRYEVVAGSHKIVASAQRRVKAIILQHGAMKLNGIASHPALAGEQQRNFCASDVMPVAHDRFDLAASLFAQEMGASLGFAFEEREFNEAEREEVHYREVFVKKNPLKKRDILKRWLSIDRH